MIYIAMFLNDNQIHNPNRVNWLNIFSKWPLYDSSDYMDYMDMQPEEGSEYWVASFIQETI